MAGLVGRLLIWGEDLGELRRNIQAELVSSAFYLIGFQNPIAMKKVLICEDDADLLEIQTL